MSENIRDIIRRINTIKSIANVTNALQKISASRLSKARNRVYGLRKYSSELEKMVYKLFEEGKEHPLLKRHLEGNTLVIVITSDKGLCGSFNSNIIEYAEKFVNSNGIEKTDVALFGKKGVTYFEKRQRKLIYKKIHLPAFIALKDLEEINNLILDLYKERKINEVYIIYNQFVSSTNAVPTSKKILPVEPKEEVETYKGAYYFEPYVETVVNSILQNFIRAQILHCFLESLASEYAQRMIMMDRASQNGKEMIDKLVNLRNKTRQAKITSELSEIVSTTNALENN